MKKMDFSTPEPKAEVLKGVNQSLIDKNKQDLFKFFNISPKAKIAATVSGLGLILFFVSIYTVSFKNNTLNTLYPKDQSQASQPLPEHLPLKTAGFILNGSQELKIAQPYILNIQLKTASETAAIMTTQIRFDNKYLEVESIDDQNSVITTWIDNQFNNSEGLISLVASAPKGLKTETADQFISIHFKVKTPGETAISVDQKNSHLYRLDKKEIPIEYDNLPIIIRP